MALQGATAIFIPTNNGLPVDRADVSENARNADIAIATNNGVSVIRADVAGRIDGMVSYGATAMVNAAGAVLSSAQRLHEDIIVADI